MWVLFSGSPGRHPTGGGGIDLYVRRFARDALSARLGRSVFSGSGTSPGSRERETDCCEVRGVQPQPQIAHKTKNQLNRSEGKKVMDVLRKAVDFFTGAKASMDQTQV